MKPRWKLYEMDGVEAVTIGEFDLVVAPVVVEVSDELKNGIASQCNFKHYNLEIWRKDTEDEIWELYGLIVDNMDEAKKMILLKLKEILSKALNEVDGLMNELEN